MFWLMMFVHGSSEMAVLITLSSLTLLEEPDACFAFGGIVKGVFGNFSGRRRI